MRASSPVTSRHLPGKVRRALLRGQGAVFLLNSPAAPDEVWDSLPGKLQQQIIDKGIKLYSIDAYDVASRSGMGKRINTIMQTCFFAISGILPREEAIASIKDAVEKTYGRKGKRIIELNFKAIDETLACLHEITRRVRRATARWSRHLAYGRCPDFVRKVTAEIIAGRGDLIPVSRCPTMAAFPWAQPPTRSATWPWRSRSGRPTSAPSAASVLFVCPHSAIRSKVFHESELAGAPATFKSAPVKAKGFPEGYHISLPGGAPGLHRLYPVCGYLPDSRQVQRQPQGVEYGAATGPAARASGKTGPFSRSCRSMTEAR